MKFLKQISIFALMTMIGGSSNAAQQWCQGTMQNLWVSGGGNVYVRPSYRADYTRMCNLNADSGSVSAMTCVAWLSILKTAVQRQSLVIVYYSEAPSCGALPTYDSAPFPYYVMQAD